MRRTSDIVMQLVTTFDRAHGAFFMERRPGPAKAIVDLRGALNDAREIDDVGTLPCPLAWWVGTQALVRAWLEAPDMDVRRGLDDAASAAIRALSRYAQGDVAIAATPHGPCVR